MVRIGKTDVTKLLQQKYKSLGNGFITVLEIPAVHHAAVNTESLRILINELGYSCVYITLSKQASELTSLYKRAGVQTNNLFFVDAISKMYGGGLVSSKKVVYASGPLDIENITSALQELLRSIKGKKCVFLDSITTVLLYNSLPRTIRFSKFLTDTLKTLGIDEIMVSITKGPATKQLVGELAKLADEIITISV
jgi:KaiC/GvpD/RAD55 family RecA-like ATPase